MPTAGNVLAPDALTLGQQVRPQWEEPKNHRRRRDGTGPPEPTGGQWEGKKGIQLQQGSLVSEGIMALRAL